MGPSSTQADFAYKDSVNQSIGKALFKQFSRYPNHVIDLTPSVYVSNTALEAFDAIQYMPK